jgi:plastocyanin
MMARRGASPVRGVTRRRVVRGVVAGFVAAGVPLLLRACGGTAKPGPRVTTGTPPRSPGSPPAGGVTGPVVAMTDQLRFVPDKLTVKVGDTVTWQNTGSVAHTVTADPAKAQNKAHVKLPAGAEPWDSGILTGGLSWSRRFDVPGEYAYFCIPHEANGMVATLTVTP